MKKLLFLGIAFLLPQLVLAAAFEITVHTGSVAVNALEGVIKLPPNTAIKSIETGNSAVLLWLTPPTFDAAARTVRFAGVSPGGFEGNEPLFTLDGSFVASDADKFAVLSLSALKADGSGSSTPVALSAELGTTTADTASPEPFMPVISRSPALFDNAPFATFLTQDKGKGIKGYEYATTWLLAPGEDDWRPAASPQELALPDLFKKVYIRATDRAGNTRVAEAAGTYRHAAMLIGGILILCVLYVSRRSLSQSSSRSLSA
jgi:hypothetical protein